MSLLKCADRQLDLSKVQVMGILNVTPDSFSDGGSLYVSNKLDAGVLLDKAQRMIMQGATILDIGGESTRPNAELVSEMQEMDRVLPALELLVKNTDVVISIDTSNAGLIRESAKMGAGMINDVRALERVGALDAALEAKLPVCLMHMKGTPKTMQTAPVYQNVVAEVFDYLLARAKLCEEVGILKEQIILDPGIGFGKNLAQNLSLLHSTTEFVETGYKLLIGTSRKSMFGQLLGREVNDRLAGSLASIAYSVMNGASILRVHDVKETVDVVKVLEAIKESNK
ncbi:MAG: dihydropteroate synthase [Oceanospirillaceae bacterium]